MAKKPKPYPPQPSPPSPPAPIEQVFDSYTLAYYSGHHLMTARIYCWQGDTRVGTIDFINEGLTIPGPNFYDGSPGGWGVYIYWPISRFSDVLTLLLNEKGLTVVFTPETGVGQITVYQKQPVG